MITSIAGIDQSPPGARRVRLNDHATGETGGRVVCVYVWPSQLVDFDKLVHAIESAEAVSGNGIDKAALRKSWDSCRSEIEQAIARASQARSPD